MNIPNFLLLKNLFMSDIELILSKYGINRLVTVYLFLLNSSRALNHYYSSGFSSIDNGFYNQIYQNRKYNQ